MFASLKVTLIKVGFLVLTLLWYPALILTSVVVIHLFTTASGVVYRLEGKCDAESMAREGYAPVTTTVFTMGFPSNYKEFLEDDLTIRESWKSDQKKRRGIPKRLDNRGGTEDFCCLFCSWSPCHSFPKFISA